MPECWLGTQLPAAALALEAANLGFKARRIAEVMEAGIARDNAERERDQARLVPRPPYGFGQEPQLDEILADARVYLDQLATEVRQCPLAIPAQLLSTARFLDESAGHMRRTAIAVARATHEEPRSAEPAEGSRTPTGFPVCPIRTATR